MRTADARWPFAIVLILTAGLLVLPFVAGGGTERLLDRHSDPALIVPPPHVVAVARSGKLYHDPRCRYIHGRATLLPLSDAVKEGFTPCPRCLGVLRANASGNFAIW